MKKIFLTIALALSLFSSEYAVDTKESNIKFEASKFMFVGVSGEFTNFSGTITLDDKNQLSSINGVVSVISINTEDEERDTHLKEDDYFFADKFPKIIFTSNKIEGETVNALVNIKGIEKEVVFKVNTLNVSSNKVSFTLSSTVDRQEFMLNGSMSAVMSDNVDVIASITATLK